MRSDNMESLGGLDHQVTDAKFVSNLAQFNAHFYHSAGERLARDPNRIPGGPWAKTLANFFPGVIRRRPSFFNSAPRHGAASRMIQAAANLI